MKDFSPDTIRALWFTYGDLHYAAKKIGVSESTISSLANADLKGLIIEPSPATKIKLEKAFQKLSSSEKRQVNNWSNIMRLNERHPNIIRAIVHASPDNREILFTKWRKYKDAATSNRQLMQWLMNYLYYLEGWRKFQWSKKR